MGKLWKHPEPRSFRNDLRIEAARAPSPSFPGSHFEQLPGPAMEQPIGAVQNLVAILAADRRESHES